MTPFARLERRLDVVTTAAAVAVVPVMLLEIAADTPGLLRLASAANWGIWLCFLGDASLKWHLGRRAWARSPAGMLSIGIVIVSFPALSSVLGAARLARLGRLTRSVSLLRTARLGLVSWRVVTGLSRALDPAALPFVTLAVVAVMAFGAAAVYFVELEPAGHTVQEALWWSVVTITTVGYGDITPQSPGGRLVAVVVMVIGIAFTSLLTAQLAAYITTRAHEKDDGQLLAEVRDLGAQVQRLAAAFDASNAGGSSQPPDGLSAPGGEAGHLPDCHRIEVADRGVRRY